MRQPNTTAKDMLATGRWAKGSRDVYIHAFGVEIRKDGACWTVGTDRRDRYTSLWAARLAAEERAT